MKYSKRHITVMKTIELIKDDLWVDDWSAIYEIIKLIPLEKLEEFLAKDD